MSMTVNVLAVLFLLCNLSSAVKYVHPREVGIAGKERTNGACFKAFKKKPFEYASTATFAPNVNMHDLAESILALSSESGPALGLYNPSLVELPSSGSLVEAFPSAKYAMSFRRDLQQCGTLRGALDFNSYKFLPAPPRSKHAPVTSPFNFSLDSYFNLSLDSYFNLSLDSYFNLSLDSYLNGSLESYLNGSVDRNLSLDSLFNFSWDELSFGSSADYFKSMLNFSLGLARPAIHDARAEIALLDENFCMVSGSRLNVPMDESAEDIRLSMEDGQLYATYVNYKSSSGKMEGRGLWYAPIEIQPKPFSVSLDSSAAQRLGGFEEKNFGLFDSETSLMALTWINWDTRPALLTSNQWRSSSDKQKWHNSVNLLELQDGSGAKLGIMHRHYDSPDVKSNFGNSYMQRFFKLSGEAPYKMEAVGPEFCLKSSDGSCETIQTIMSLLRAPADKLIISYGVNDCEPRIATFSILDVLKSLTSPPRDKDGVQVMHVKDRQRTKKQLAKAQHTEGGKGAATDALRGSKKAEDAAEPKDKDMMMEALESADAKEAEESAKRLVARVEAVAAKTEAIKALKLEAQTKKTPATIPEDWGRIAEATQSPKAKVANTQAASTAAANTLRLPLDAESPKVGRAQTAQKPKAKEVAKVEKVDLMNALDPAEAKQAEDSAKRLAAKAEMAAGANMVLKTKVKEAVKMNKASGRTVSAKMVTPPIKRTKQASTANWAKGDTKAEELSESRLEEVWMKRFSQGEQLRKTKFAAAFGNMIKQAAQTKKAKEGFGRLLKEENAKAAKSETNEESLEPEESKEEQERARNIARAAHAQRTAEQAHQAAKQFKQDLKDAETEMKIERLQKAARAGEYAQAKLDAAQEKEKKKAEFNQALKEASELLSEED